MSAAMILAHRKMWLEALEGEGYEQTRGNLVNDTGDAFCCLGVACDLIDPDVWHKVTRHEGEAEEYTDDNPSWGEYTDVELPPPTVMASVYGVGGELSDTLASKNDGGDSFEDIAAYLRIQWEM